MKMQLELHQQHVLKLHRKLQEEMNVGIEKKLPKRCEKIQPHLSEDVESGGKNQCLLLKSIYLRV